MAFCNQCGKENPDNAKFCSSCGAALSNMAKTEPEPGSKQGVFTTGLATEIPNESFGSSVFHKFFTETDPTEIWSLFLPIMLFNLALSLALTYFDFWIPDTSLDTTTLNIIHVALTALIYVLVKSLAIDKGQKLWLLPALALYAFGLFIQFTEGTMDYSPAIQATINDSPGIKTKLILQAIGWWDFVVGGVIEFFLLIRIFLNIKPKK